MATLNVSVTQSNVLLTSAVSSGSTLDFVIDNPIPYTSYFTLETVADNNGFYTNSTSKNTSGSFTLGTGQFGLIQSDYIASVVVPSGSTTLRFIPAVNIPASTLYLRGIGAGPYSTITTYLLDTYSGATVAYSLRLLSSTYAGSAIRVRRSSDNTEQNIGFDSSGNLDTASLLSFCGAGNGFVTTWYDQSGNGNNATQTTAANQPQIVSAGSVILKNNKPSVNFDGTNDFFSLSSSIATSINYSFFSAAYNESNATGDTYMSGVVGSAQFINDLSGATGNMFIIKTTVVIIISGTITKDRFNLNTFFTHNASNSVYTNGSLVNSNTLTPSFTNPITAIGRNNHSATEYYLNGISEMILYSSNQASNRTGIESNINTYYAIY